MHRRAPLAAAGTTAIGTAGCLSVVDGSNDAYEWIHETGSRRVTVSRGRVFGREPAPAVDGSTEGDGALFALDAPTGEPLWSYGSSGPYEGYTPPTVRDGVYTSYATDVADRPHEIHALEFDGSVRWDGVHGWLEGIDDGVAYVTGDGDDPEDRELRALETSEADRLWRTDETGAVAVDRAETGGHETVYVDGSDLVALDRADGSVRWRYGHESASRTRAIVDGVAYVTTDDSVAAIAEGTERWRVDAATGREIRGVESDRLLVDFAADRTDATGGVRALETGTGDERWRWERPSRRRRTRDRVHVATRDGVVYVGDGGLTALDAADGTERWSDSVAEDAAIASLSVVDWEGTDRDHAVAVTTSNGGFAMYDPQGERFCSDDFGNDIRDVAVAELAFVATSERIYAFDAW